MMPASERGLPLTSERLILRNPADRDFAAMLGYYNDPELARYVDVPPMTEGRIRDFIDRQRERQLGVPGEWTQVAIERRDTGEMVGDLGFRVSADYPHEAELGYRIAREHQHRGFALEAASRLLDHAFTALGLHRVIAYTGCENEPSIRLLERLGFRQEGQMTKSYMVRGAWIDEYLYAVLDEEWPSV
jgi:RimJ/RimL family protein N-acetyltransferase